MYIEYEIKSKPNWMWIDVICPQCKSICGYESYIDECNYPQYIHSGHCNKCQCIFDYTLIKEDNGS